MPDQQEGTVDVEQIDTLLAKLVKASDAGALIKGGIENSGTHGSGGPQGGGQGSMSDSGGLDAMMIGKMAAAGIPLSVINDFAAFMSEDDEDEDPEGDGMDKSASAKPRKPAKPAAEETVQKSFREALSENAEMKEMVDVFPYLDGMTTLVAEQIDGLQKSLSKREAKQQGINKAYAAALHQIGQLVKSQHSLIEKMGAKLGILERAPVAKPKAVTGTAEPIVKSMPGESGAGDEQLTKSEVLSTLSYMNLEKGMREIGGRRTFELIGLLEGGGVYDGVTHEAVTGFLKSLPTSERTLAKSYH